MMTSPTVKNALRQWFPALLALVMALALALFAAWKYELFPSTHPNAGVTAAGAQASVPTVSQYFSPGDDLENVWVSHINAAQQSIHIACFGLSNGPIAQALEGASRDRHVEVIIIEDHRQAKLPSDLHEELIRAGCHIVVKRSRVLLHDKMGVFDDGAAIIGSYNLSRAAEEQDNSDVVFDHDPTSASIDEGAWERMFQRETGRGYTPGMNLPPMIPEGAL